MGMVYFKNEKKVFDHVFSRPASYLGKYKKLKIENAVTLNN